MIIIIKQIIFHTYMIGFADEVLFSITCSDTNIDMTNIDNYIDGKYDLVLDEFDNRKETLQWRKEILSDLDGDGYINSSN